MRISIYVILGTYFAVCKSQYVSINTKSSKLNPCDNLSSTSYVERFFDLIFVEFHNTPPACVCIQMCADQATYCYPNGCLRRPERRVEDTKCLGETVRRVNVEVTTKSATFAVEHKDVVDDFMEAPALSTSYRETRNRPKISDFILQSNPFKDLVFKYQRVPTLKMKYNLPEQVRNTKSEKINNVKNIDISRTRWPAKKHLLHGISPLKSVHRYKKNDDTKQTKFFVSLSSENEPTNYSPVFYKKYLTKRDDSSRPNIDGLYLYHTDTANFTLETLIDGLIENTLDDNKKDIVFTLNIEDNDTVKEEPSTEISINFADIDFLLEENNNTVINNKTTVNIISIDSANENAEVNKYSHENNETYQNAPEFIANMSKQIDVQNEVTLKFMERVMGRKSLNESTTNVSVTETVFEMENATNTLTTVPITETVFEMENVTNISTAVPIMDKSVASFGNVNSNVTPVPITPASVYRKTKQRIMRKLKRRKIK
ncbi:uncharacterized protein LOC112054695 [Bicyclus anynana]|uniref:Uncharacterized protein LOC112054695 n=1 Tax=Bicyclus anynana TaxID=110368 RepID=A0ABM3M7S1_BICAN|nr:uncharacterized protein LOC112054695 [Bicyclus anynana]